MLKKLVPDLYLESVYRLDPGYLTSRGIKAVIFDLDNTLSPWGHRGEPSEKLLQWFTAFRESGLRIAMVSNNGPERVGIFASALGIPAVPKAGKPRRRAFQRALECLSTRPEETAMVGDQVFTDVFGGNRLGLFTVLVVPINRREFIGTRLVRHIERVVLRAMLRRGLIEAPVK